jgi:hypothetical protein
MVMVLLAALLGCEQKKPQTKLVYFGFDNRAEKPEEMIRLAEIWKDNPPCSHWRLTIKPETADYQVLFGTTELTIVDRRGEIVYHGDQDVMETPYGKPDGSGVNVCQLTGGQIHRLTHPK